MMSIDIDFLPPQWRARRAKRRTVLSRVGAILLILVVIAATQGYAAHRNHELDLELNRVTNEHSLARTRIAQVEDLDRRKQELARRLELLKDVLKRARGADIISAVGRAAPATVELEQVDFRVNDIGGIPAIELTINGKCPNHDDASRFAENLRNDPALSTARLVFSRDSTPPGTKEFDISGLAPGLLREPPPLVAADGPAGQNTRATEAKR